MNLSSASATSALSARAVPVSATLPLVGKRLTSTAEIGSSIAVSYPTADIAYAVEIVADSASDQVEIDLFTGIATLTTGTPSVVGAAGDFSAVTLPTAVNLMALRLSCPSTNTGKVAVGFTMGADLFTPALVAGQIITIQYAADGLALVTDDQLAITFEDADDELLIEIIAATA